MYGGRDAATAASDEAARRPSVVRQADVDHGLPSVIVLRVTLTSPSSPACGWLGLPQPRLQSREQSNTTPCMTGSLAHSLHGLEIPLLPRAAVNRAYRLALATKLGGTALARLWPRFAQCSRNMPSMARSSAGLISRECATVTE
jgi:hypothetical protein